MCTLFLDEDVNGRRVATVEEVGTLPARRGRGLARAVVCAAVADAGRWGADLIVVPADADDWPQLMYARLGFTRGGPPGGAHPADSARSGSVAGAPCSLGEGMDTAANRRRRGDPRQPLPRALPGRLLRRAAAPPPAGVRARPARRRGVGRSREPRARLLRAARRPRRAAVLDVARRLRAPGRDRSPTGCASSSAAAATTTRGAPPPPPPSPSPSPSCGSAGEGDLLVQLERLRRRLTPRGCSSPRSACRGRAAPDDRGRHRRARQGARRRAGRACAAAAGAGGSSGPSPPSRTATRRRGSPPRCASWRPRPEVEVVIVARGGGSLADLFAFCDEALCRTVALLRVPVISSVGHHTDRTLIDDVAAVCCSTPTHAAEAAVPVDCAAARRALAAAAARLRDHGRRAILDRARTLVQLSRAPAPARRPPPRPPAPAAARAARLGAPRRPRAGASARARHAALLERTAARAADGDRARRARSSSGWPWRWRPTTRSARWRAATRWCRTAPATPLGSAAAARAARDADPALPRRSGRGRGRRRARRAHERRRAPTSRPWAGSRRSSAAWTPARPACARRSTSSARGASWSSTAPASWTPSARASRSCAWRSSSRASDPRAAACAPLSTFDKPRRPAARGRRLRAGGAARAGLQRL